MIDALLVVVLIVLQRLRARASPIAPASDGGVSASPLEHEILDRKKWRDESSAKWIHALICLKFSHHAGLLEV